MSEENAGAEKPGMEKRRIEVCASSELPEGERKIVKDGYNSIGIFNIKGEFFALDNVCPHAGAPLCRGDVLSADEVKEYGYGGPEMAGCVVRCPYHGWEFNIKTGQGMYVKDAQVTTYPVEVSPAGKLVLVV
ncbi:MAG: Rieske (2Fe-2S) protein [Planctomycetota bacterium]